MNTFITERVGSWPRFALNLHNKSYKHRRTIMRVSVFNVILLLGSIKALQATPVYGQDLEKVSVKLELNDEKLAEAFQQIEQQVWIETDCEKR